MLFSENLIKNCALDYIIFNLFIGFLIYILDGSAKFIFKTDEGYFFTNKATHEVPEHYSSFYSFKKLTKCQKMKLKKKIQKGN